jgi:antitoxin HicB
MTPKDYLRQPYTRVMIPDESGGFHAEIFEFPGCFAQGETLEETYKNLEGAAESWVQARLHHDQPVPEPFNNTGYSGNISLRLPRSIHKRAALMAERERSSLNTYLVSAVSARVGAEDLWNVLACRLEKQIFGAAVAAIQAWKDYESEQTSNRKIKTHRLNIEKSSSTNRQIATVGR